MGTGYLVAGKGRPRQQLSGDQRAWSGAGTFCDFRPYSPWLSTVYGLFLLDLSVMEATMSCWRWEP